MPSRDKDGWRRGIRSRFSVGLVVAMFGGVLSLAVIDSSLQQDAQSRLEHDASLVIGVLGVAIWGGRRWNRRCLDSEAQASRRTEARLQTVFETVGDGIIIFDSLGVIETANPAACRLFGYQAGEMVGRSVTMLMPESVRGSQDSCIRRHIVTGAGRPRAPGRDVVGLRRTGGEFPAQLAVGVLCPGEDEVLFVGVIRDLTELRGAQDALAAAAAQLASQGERAGAGEGDAPRAQTAAVMISGTLSALLDDIPAGALDHIVESYIVDARARLIRMGEAIMLRDCDALEREAHSIKSSSRTFGLEALGALAERIETASRAAQEDQAVTASRDLIASSEAAFATLRAELARIGAAAS